MIGSLDFSGMNFDFGTTDFGLGNFNFTGSVFTPEQETELQKKFEQSNATIETPKQTSPPVIPPADGQPKQAPEASDTTKKPIPNPLPPLPKPDDLSGTKPIGVNPQRYRVDERDWQISAKEGLPKVTGVFGDRPVNWIPQLRANGIVLKLTLQGFDAYLISPQTLSDIQKSGNPHYDVAENGMVLKTVIGKTVPVIVLDMAKVDELIKSRDVENANAGVRDVVYVNEGAEEIDGIPRPLLDQINYTLDSLSSRPADKFSVFRLGLRGNYDLKNFLIETKQPDGTLDRDRLKKFLSGIKERQRGWQEDLNLIKRLFYEARIPDGLVHEEYEQVASSTEPYRSSKTYLIKETELAASTGTQADKAAEKSNEDKAKSTAPPLPSFITNKVEAQAKWNGYGFSTVEADTLLNPRTAGTRNVYIGNRTVNINILWNPGVVNKARIVPNLPSAPPIKDGPFWSIALDLVKYYGTLPNTNASNGFTDDEWVAYVKANEQRMAELLLLAITIKELSTAGEKPQVSDRGPAGSGGGGRAGKSDDDGSGTEYGRVNDERGGGRAQYQ